MSQPVVCVYGPNADQQAVDTVRSGVPAGVAVVPARGPSGLPLGSLIAALAGRLGGRDLVLVSADVKLPAHWLQRLTAIRDADSRVGTVNPLYAGELGLAELAFGDQPLERLDRRLFHLGDRRYSQRADPDDQCVLVTNKVIAAARKGESLQAALARSGLVAVRCEHLLAARANEHDEPVADARLRAAARKVGDLERLALPTGPGLDQPRQVLLHILHGWGGGTERWVNDFAAGDQAACHVILKARSDPDAGLTAIGYDLHLGSTRVAPLRSWPLPVAIQDTSDRNLAAQAILREVVDEFDVDAVLVSSLIGHDLAVLDTGKPTVMVLHDYYPFCSALNIYFGEVCQSCEPDRLRRCLTDNPNNQLFTRRDADSWLNLRHAFARRLARGGIAMVAPTRTVAEAWARLEPAFANAPCEVVPHGIEHWGRRVKAPSDQEPGQRLRLAVVGRIHGGKGLGLLMDALEELSAVADLYLLGCGKEGEAFFGRSHVHLILNYEHAALPDHLDSIRPHFALLLSTVPETFSYTLSELMALGLPTLATRLGSFAERIEPGVNGWLVRPEARALVDQIKALRRTPERIRDVREHLHASEVQSLAGMASDYRRLLPAPGRAALDYRPRQARPRGLAIAQLTAEVQELRDALRQWRQTAEQRQMELHRRAQWVTDLESQDSGRLAWIARLEEELKKTRGDFDSLQDDFDERTRWVNQLQQEIADARNDHQSAMRALHEKEQALRETEQRMQREAARLQADLEYTRNRLRAIEQSTIWRATRPLRVVGTWFKRPFKGPTGHGNLARLIRSLRMRGFRDTLSLVRERLSKSRSAPKAPEAVDLDQDQAIEPFELPNAIRPTVSIVIPVYNQLRHTYACLKSIKEHTGEIPFEIIVVDDCSSDDTPELLPRFEGLRYRRNEANLGFIGACNAGADLAAGEYVLFLNNDTTLSDGWLEALLHTFETFPDCGMAGARLVYPDGRLQESGGIVFSDGSGWNYGRFEDPGDPRFSYAREADYCSGACIMLRRDLFDELGGFDSHYAPAYYEDTDLAFKIRQHGLRVIVQPACSIVHYEGVTSGTDTASGTKRYQVVNQEKFVERWRQQLADQPDPGSDIEIAKEHRCSLRALVIDACVPTPDQDSGSVRMSYLLRLLGSLGYKVSFVAENLRYEGPYTVQLQAQGVEMLYAPFVASIEDWLRDHGAELDLVLVSRHYIASQFMDLIERCCPRARVLFDTVDLHYLREQRQAELEDSEALRKQAIKTRDSELAVARAADHTLVVSPAEVEELTNTAPSLRVSVLSNIHPIHGCRMSFDQRRDLFFVGGFQHPPNVDAVMWFVDAVWPAIRAEVGDVTFHVVGSRAPGSISRLDAPGVEVHGFVEDLTPFLDGCRLAVAPLRYGAGVKGKVNMSMSYGQPVVATSMAVEGMYAREGEDVLIADEADDFAQAVMRLYQDEDLWNRLSAGGLENVRRYFSLDAARANLRNILESLDLPDSRP